MPKRHFMAAILKSVIHTAFIVYLFDSGVIGFIDPGNIVVYTKIVLINGLETKILPKTQCNDCRGLLCFCL